MSALHTLAAERLQTAARPHASPASVTPADAPSWAGVARWEDLVQIRMPTLNALVLRREDPLGAAGITDRVFALDGDWERVSDRGEAAEVLAARLCAPVRSAPMRAHLEADVAQCIRAFRGLVDTPFIASLAPVVQVQCPKFHADRVSLRLLCTYVGPGTEWLEDAHVRREALGQPIADLEEANRRIQCCPEGLHRAAMGDVLLLKGERWPGNAGRGAVHRSPAMPSGEARLVLTLSAGLGAW